MENESYPLFNFRLSMLDARVTNEKGEEVLNRLISATKINLALGLFFESLIGEYRYFFAHENNYLFDKCPLLGTKAVLITIEGKVEKFGFLSKKPKNLKQNAEIHVDY